MQPPIGVDINRRYVSGRKSSLEELSCLTPHMVWAVNKPNVHNADYCLSCPFRMRASTHTTFIIYFIQLLLVLPT